MKHLFTFVFIGFALSAFSQTEKGNSFISGNISTGYSKIDYPDNVLNKSNSFSISTGISYGTFIKDNIVWRTDVSETFHRNSWSAASGNQKTESKDRNMSISVSTIGLYYFGKERWRGFVGGGIGLNGSFYKRNAEGISENSSSKDNSWGIYPVFEAGAMYFFNKRLALQLSARTNSFPINTAGFSTGLLYWIKPTSFDVEPKELSTLQKGRWMLGANFQINTHHLEDVSVYQSITNENMGGVFFQVGRFVKDRTIVGLNLGYNTRNITQKSPNTTIKIENTIRSYTGGVFLKKYIIANRFTPYYRIGLNYTKNDQKNKNTVGSSSFHSNSYELIPSIGLAYLISNSFLVEAQLADLYLYHIVENSGNSGTLKRWGSDISGSLRSGLSLSYVF